MRQKVYLSFLFSAALTACSSVPSSGPARKDIEQLGYTNEQKDIHIVPVTEDISRTLLGSKHLTLFSEVFGDRPHVPYQLAVGDTLEVSIWEAPPASLFGGTTVDPRAGSAIGTSRGTTFPDQTINSDGNISLPFVGTLRAATKTPQLLETEIAARLRGKANQPQVMVKSVRNPSTNATVLGDVVTSQRISLASRQERILDAIAAAGGTKNPVSKITLQLTRERRAESMSLERIIRDPRQNITLVAGDILTALYQPLSFVALGATGRNEEIGFEGDGISLAQALGRIGGVQDARADVRGLFIYREEDPRSASWIDKPNRLNANGKIPIIYTVNLSDPTSFFVMQTFMVSNKDIIYVSNAPLQELQKFVNVVSSIAFPVLNTILLTR